MALLKFKSPQQQSNANAIQIPISLIRPDENQPVNILTLKNWQNSPNLSKTNG